MIEGGDKGIRATPPRALGTLLAAALIAFAIVAPLLLTVDLPGWPALRMVTLWHKTGGPLVMSSIVMLGAWLPDRLAPSLRCANPTRAGRDG